MVTSMGNDVMMMLIFSFSIIHISFRLCPLARKRSKQNLFANFASQLREILGLSWISIELINSMVTLRFDNGRHRLSYAFLRKPVPLEKGDLICIASTSLMYSLSYHPSKYLHQSDFVLSSAAGLWQEPDAWYSYFFSRHTSSIILSEIYWFMLAELWPDASWLMILDAWVQFQSRRTIPSATELLLRCPGSRFASAGVAWESGWATTSDIIHDVMPSICVLFALTSQMYDILSSWYDYY
jgi:hypothetical protein